jgi:hypothetical protein
VTVQLAREAIVDAATLIIGATALLLLAAARVNSAWLILAGAAVGLAIDLL